MEIRELEKLGKNISEEYVKNHTDLTENLQKVASQNGLNKQQLARVAETANVETYLSLIKTASDKYVKFPLADAKKAYTEITKTANYNPLTADEDYSPETADVKSIFTSYSKLEKTAKLSEESKTKLAECAKVKPADAKSKVRKEATKIAAELDFLNDHLLETKLELEQTYEKLRSNVKQAALSGVSFGDIDTVLVKAAYYTGAAISNKLKTELAPTMPHVDLEKNAETSKAVNTKSTIYKLASGVDDYFSYISMVEDSHKLHKDYYAEFVAENELPSLLKHASVGETIKDMFTWIKEHPTTTTIIAIPAAYKLGTEHGKKEARPKMIDEIRANINHA